MRMGVMKMGMLAGTAGIEEKTWWWRAGPINHHRMVSSAGLSQEEQEFLDQHRLDDLLKP